MKSQCPVEAAVAGQLSLQAELGRLVSLSWMAVEELVLSALSCLQRALGLGVVVGQACAACLQC